MKERWVGYLPALLLAALAGLTYWLDQRVQPEDQHENWPEDRTSWPKTSWSRA